MAALSVNTDMDFSAPSSSTPAVGASKLLKILTANSVAIANAAGDLARSANFTYQEASAAAPQLLLQAAGATFMPFAIKGAASQSADLQQWQNSSGVALSCVDSTGRFMPGVAAGVDLASATMPFKDLWLAGSSGTPGTNNFRITGTATAARVITLPDASITLSGSASVLTSGRVPFATTGGLLTDIAGFQFQSAASPNLTVTAQNAAHIPLIVKGAASQSVDLTQWQNSAGTVLAKVNSVGESQFVGLGVGAANTSAISVYISRSNPLISGTNYAQRIDASSTTTTNGTNYQAGLYVKHTDHSISAGVTESGQRYGAQFDSFINQAGFAGTLTTQAAFIATAGIVNAASTGRITNVYGAIFNIYNSIASATIDNIYGVYVDSAITTTGANTVRYDYYGAASVARNYFAGQLAVGLNIATAQAQFTTTNASRIGLIVRGAASQTANLQEWQNSSGTVLSGIDASGRFYAPTALTASTVGAAGGASALPATPTGYILVNVNGTQMKVPYFAN